MFTNLILLISIIIIGLLILGIRAYLRKKKNDGKDKIYPLW